MSLEKNTTTPFRPMYKHSPFYSNSIPVHYPLPLTTESNAFSKYPPSPYYFEDIAVKRPETKR